MPLLDREPVLAELTVAAVIEREGKFLVVEESVAGEKLINQPAGHAELGETVVEAVIRETQEETAWGFQPEAITGIYLWHREESDQTFLRVAFCGQLAEHDPKQALDDGILRAFWLSRDALARREHRLRSPMVLRCIDDYLGGKRLPMDLIQNLTADSLSL